MSHIPHKAPNLVFIELEYTDYSRCAVQNETEPLAFHNLLIAMDGRGALDINGEQHAAARGTCFFLSPGAVVRSCVPTDSDFRLYRLSFQVLEDQDQLFVNRSGCLQGTTAQLEHMLQSLHEASAAASGMEVFQRHVLFQQVVYESLRRLPVAAAGNERRESLERSINYLNRHFTDDIEIGSLAEQANMTRWQYSAAFKALTGRTPKAYLTDLRIERAKQLMSAADAARIREVAELTGFGDEYYFSRRFKQATGLSPSAYKQRHGRTPRIFSIQYLGELLALGIRPVGTNRTMLSALPEAAASVDAVDDQPLDTDQVQQLQPDLILFPSFLPPRQAKELNKIAPAVEVSWEDDVYARMQRLGDMLGRTREAEAWIARYEAKAEQVRSRLDAWLRPGETASAFIYHNGRLHVYAGHHFGHTLYRGLGFRAPDSGRRLMEKRPCIKWKTIPLSALADYAGDRVFMALADSGVDAEEGRLLLQHAAWRDLPAVRSGHGYVVEQLWGNYNPITLEKHLDETMKLLTQGSVL